MSKRINQQDLAKLTLAQKNGAKNPFGGKGGCDAKQINIFNTTNVNINTNNPGDALRAVSRQGLGNSKNANDLGNIWAGREQSINHTNFRQQDSNGSIFSYYGHNGHGGVGQCGVHSQPHCQMMNDACENEKGYYKTSSQLQKSTNQPTTIAYAQPVQQAQQAQKGGCQGGSGAKQSEKSSGTNWGGILAAAAGGLGAIMAGIGIYDYFWGDDKKSASGAAAKSGTAASASGEAQSTTANVSGSASTTNTTGGSDSAANAAVTKSQEAISKSESAVAKYEAAAKSGDEKAISATKSDLKSARKDLNKQSENLKDSVTTNQSRFEQLQSEERIAQSQLGEATQQREEMEKQTEDKNTELGRATDDKNAALKEQEEVSGKINDQTKVRNAAKEKKAETAGRLSKAKTNTPKMKAALDKAETDLTSAQKAYEDALGSGADPSAAQTALQSAQDTQVKAKADYEAAVKEEEAAQKADDEQAKVLQGEEEKLNTLTQTDKPAAEKKVKEADLHLQNVSKELNALKAKEATLKTKVEGFTQKQKDCLTARDAASAQLEKVKVAQGDVETALTSRGEILDKL